MKTAVIDAAIGQQMAQKVVANDEEKKAQSFNGKK